MRRALAAVLLLAATPCLAACGSSGRSTPEGSSEVLVGAGSSLVYPLLAHWSDDYGRRSGVSVTFGPLGSGGGVAQITARSVDFGASDAPLTADESRAANGVVQIPWALAATVVAYNLKGAPNRLRLTGSVLAGIYLGAITAWDDPRIAGLNPGVGLPATRITPIFRTDGSGDTYAFTDYLSQVSPAWKRRVGASTQVTFPRGIGGRGNSGVGSSLSRTDGGIAYIAIPYVRASRFHYALIRNRGGAYPLPGPASIAAAARALRSIAADNTASLVDPPASAPGAYPLATLTYALVPRESAKAAALKSFLRYAIGPGQELAPRLSFARLTPRVLAADRRAIASIGN